MYKLFYALKSASMGVGVMLEEIGAPYELIPTTVDPSKTPPPEQLAINPNGWVPVLVWDDGSMYECAAITVFLFDRHPQAKLAPGIDGPARVLYLQTLFRMHFSSPTTPIDSPTQQEMSRVHNGVETDGSGKPGR